MPKIDVEAVPAEERTIYPPEYARLLQGRSKKRLGDAAGLSQFGVNLTRLKPGAGSAHRHWHQSEDEFVFILEGEVVLVEDQGETLLTRGDAAAFKAGVPIGHQLINRSARDAVLLEVGTRSAKEVVTYTDAAVDMRAAKENGPWILTRRNREPF